MKYLKDYRLFENNQFPTDHEEIRKICQKYGIKNYTVNTDGTVDVDGDVDLNGQSLSKLPLKFGKVFGFFLCSSNQLTSLEGAPKAVGKSFNCTANKLTSLRGAPLNVPGDFGCQMNKLTSLEGSPEKVVGGFTCYMNNLITLEGAPKKVGGNFYCSMNPAQIFSIIFQTKENLLKSLEYNYFAGGNKIHESRFVRACDDLGITAPDQIKGYVWV